MLASKPVKILAVYLSPSQPVFDSDLSACPRGVLSNLNAKHVDWNFRLITTMGRHLHDYASENSCLIYGLEKPTFFPLTLLPPPMS
jgi:hypothetical protein